MERFIIEEGGVNGMRHREVEAQQGGVKNSEREERHRRTELQVLQWEVWNDGDKRKVSGTSEKEESRKREQRQKY